MGDWPRWKAKGWKICDRVAVGESLATICAESGMPKPRTFARWVRTYPELGQRWEDTRQMLAQLRFDQTWELVRDLPDDAAGRKAKMEVLRWQATHAVSASQRPAPKPKVVFKRAQL